jgi:hypothetical protein
MRHGGWKFSLVALFLCLGTASVAPAADKTRTQWQLSSFTWVKRVPAEAGAPANAHPALFTAAQLGAALAPVQVRAEGEVVPLFSKDELAGLGKALAEAFALAQPGEDLILLSTSRRGGFFMEEPLALTARLFVREQALNLLVHDARLSFMGRYQAENVLPKFEYGSRTQASKITLQGGAKALRSDWLSLIPGFPVEVAPAAVVAASPASSPAPKPKAAEATPEVKDAAFYEAQTQRLKALKRMRDEKVLSEAEYQEKRDAILKTL